MFEAPFGAFADGVHAAVEDDEQEMTYQAHLELDSILRFDFGTDGTPVENGFIGVGDDLFDLDQRGYGWLNTGATSFTEHDVGDRVARDGLQLSDGTFVTFLPDGDYEVSVIMGSQDDTLDQVELSLEGQLVDVVNTSFGGYHQASYPVTVSGELLELELVDLGGATPAATLNALTITPVGLDPFGQIQGVK